MLQLIYFFLDFIVLLTLLAYIEIYKKLTDEYSSL